MGIEGRNQQRERNHPAHRRHDQQHWFSSDAIRECWKKKRKEKAPEARGSEEEPGGGGRLPAIFRDEKRRKNIEQEQPGHKARRSRATEPHVAVAQDGKKIANPDGLTVQIRIVLLFRLSDEFPNQQPKQETGNSAHEKRPAPAPASRHLRR